MSIWWSGRVENRAPGAQRRSMAAVVSLGAAPADAPDPEARRLLWRCRRGMKELDVLLERYVRSQLPRVGERQVLARLLELPDPLLADYLFGHATATDPELARLVAAIRSPQGA